MRYVRRSDPIEYGGRERPLKTLGWWCDDCNEAIFYGPALIAREKAFLQLKAEVEGVLGPKDVARVRKKLALSQRRAGALLGGGPRSFQKYERGTQAVSTPMSHLLRLLDNDPKRVNEIREEVAKYERRKKS
jgi:HTH-type transcriptional regulator/antitoxin MqsA